MLCWVWPDRRKNIWERKTILELIFLDEENILTLKMFSRKLENLVECKEFDYQDYVKFRQNYNLSCDVLIQFVHSSDYLEIKIKVRSGSEWVQPVNILGLGRVVGYLGNPNVQPGVSCILQTGEEWGERREVPCWLIICEATQHCPPIGPIVNSQMGKHPSSWAD